MTQDHEQLILQGADGWNKWQEENKSPVHFAKPFWYDSRNSEGMQVKGLNKLDFSGIHLTNASIYHAFAEGLNFRRARIVGCHFEEGDFSRTDFSGTTFIDTKFNKTIFTDSVFAGSVFPNCNLNRVNLANANFCVEAIIETVVYGVSAWDLKTNDEMKQSNLIIERTYDLYSDIIARGQIPHMVDDIEMAQFVYYLSSHKKMRNMINILNSKGVLLLGRFKEGGLERLYKLRDWLKAQNYTPMIFDFDRPTNLDYTETVITMAGLSKFILADLSGGSVPQELHAIMTNFRKPVIAYAQNGVYSMFKDLKRKNPYVFELEYTDDQELLSKMANILKDAEHSHVQIVQELAETYENKS